jgi:hypothetical protein
MAVAYSYGMKLFRYGAINLERALLSVFKHGEGRGKYTLGSDLTLHRWCEPK